MPNKGRKNENKGNNKGLIILFIVLIVICAVAGAIYVDTFYGSGKLKSYVTGISQEKNEEAEGETGGAEETAPTEKRLSEKETMALDDGTRGTIAVFDKQFMLCTKDGVKFFDSMGSQKWNDTFNMLSPQMMQEGKYVAVGDMSGKSLRVYDTNGLIYSVQTEGNLHQFGINESGYLSLISKEQDSYRIQIYNAKGVLLKGRMEESQGIFPLSSDVSDDNKVFAVSYLDTTDIEPIGRVLFFYINQEDSETLVDSMFAAVEKPGEVIPVIAYMKGGLLMAFSDRALYGMGGDGKEAWTYELNNVVSQISFGFKEQAVLALEDSLANKDGKKAGTICWVDTSGKERATYENGKSATYLKATDKGVVVGSEWDYIGIRNNGKEAWKYRASTDFKDMIPMENINKIMAVAKSSATVMEMKGQKIVVNPGENKTAEPEAAQTAEQESAAEEGEETPVPEAKEE